MEGTDSLKREVFTKLMEMAGRVFILVRYSEAVKIGNRRFTEEEKKNGLVLVFTRGMKYAWDDFGIRATLVFSSTPQKCFIPSGDIIVVYCPEMGVQLAVSAREGEGRETGASRDKSVSADIGAAAESRAGNIIRVNFRKRGRGPAR